MAYRENTLDNEFRKDFMRFMFGVLTLFSGFVIAVEFLL